MPYFTKPSAAATLRDPAVLALHFAIREERMFLRSRMYEFLVRATRKLLFLMKAWATYEPLPVASLVGRTLIVGLTYEDHEHQFVRQEQYFGRIIRAHPNEGVVIQLANGEQRKLPPDHKAFKRARRGQYRFRSSGEVVSDREYETTWMITLPKPNISTGPETHAADFEGQR